MDSQAIAIQAPTIPRHNISMRTLATWRMLFVKHTISRQQIFARRNYSDNVLYPDRTIQVAYPRQRVFRPALTRHTKLHIHKNNPDRPGYRPSFLANVPSSPEQNPQARRLPRGFTYHAQDGKIDHNELQEAIQNLRVTPYSSESALVVMATLEHRHLLNHEDPSHFIPRLVQHVSTIAGLSNVRVITGIVDRVAYPRTDNFNDYAVESAKPVPREWADIVAQTVVATMNGAAGIAVKISDGVYVDTPDTRPGCISFATQFARPPDEEPPIEPTFQTSIDVNLAQTIMHTGKEYFLEEQTWDLSEGSSARTDEHSTSDLPSHSLGYAAESSSEATLTLTDSRPIYNVQLTKFNESRGARKWDCSVPNVMFPITQPRRVHSALGNVIREFDNHVPASHELEQNITAFSQRFANFEIWAAVGSNKPSLTISHGPNRQRLQTLVRGGMSLYRVHGGGGGWDGQGGPITLDPGAVNVDAINVVDQAKTEADDMQRFPPYFENSLVKPGDVVQLYGIGIKNADRADMSTMVKELKYKQRIGTLPIEADRVSPETPNKLGWWFGVLGQQATISIHRIPIEGHDHGEHQLGLVHKMNLPPYTASGSYFGRF